MIYDNPQKEYLERNLEGVFRSHIMARYQSGLGNYKQCIMMMFPRNWEQNVTVSIRVDRKAGFEIIGLLDLQPLSKVQTVQGQAQYYSNMLIERLNLLGPSLYAAIIGTGLYKSASGSRCSCIDVFFFDDDDDIVFSIMVDQDVGFGQVR